MENSLSLELPRQSTILPNKITKYMAILISRAKRSTYAQWQLKAKRAFVFRCNRIRRRRGVVRLFGISEQSSAQIKSEIK